MELFSAELTKLNELWVDLTGQLPEQNDSIVLFPMDTLNVHVSYPSYQHFGRLYRVTLGVGGTVVPSQRGGTASIRETAVSDGVSTTLENV